MSYRNETGKTMPQKISAELRTAQLELLSAQCATDRLRLHYSTEDVVKHGRTDVLRRAIHAASQLYQYYSALEISRTIQELRGESQSLWESQGLLQEATAKLAAYFRDQRERFFPQAVAVPEPFKINMERYFSPEHLAATRMLELLGDRLPNPGFYGQAREVGFTNLPDITHMSAVTFVDLVVFNERVTERSLFHGLVHTVQSALLGVDRYAELFVLGYSKRKSHFNVPLESHAVALESKFASGQTFSVEEDVWKWINSGRYAVE